MTAEELFMEQLGFPPPGASTEMMNIAENKPKPINDKCPIRTGRDADPSIIAKNENGETVAFCCDNCKDQFVSKLPAMEEMMADMDGSSGSSQSYERKGTKTRDTNSLRASEVGHPAPPGHFIRQFGGSPRDQIQVSHKQASVDQVLACLLYTSDAADE